jgi:hypothetical protein
VAQAAALTTPFEAAMAALGEPVLSNAEAAARIRELSVDPTTLEVAKANEVKQQLLDAQSALVAGDVTKALPHLRVLDLLSAAQRDSLANDNSAARLMETTCLTAAELELRGRAASKGDAEARLARCRQMFPALKLSESAYPSELIALFNAPSRRAVQIDGEPGCEVLLNGARVGKTPLALDVFPEPARVQLMCDGRPTRVHSVRLGDRPAVMIDRKLDAGIHTDRGLYLVGPELVAGLQSQLAARVVPLFVEIVDGLRVEVARVGSAPLFYDLARGYRRDEVDDAVRALRSPQSKPLAKSSVEVPTSEPVVDTASPERASSDFPLGPVIVAGTGVALLGAGLVTSLLAHSRDSDVRRFVEQCSPCQISEQQQQRVQDLHDEAGRLYTATAILLVTGGVSVAAGVAWFFWRPTGPESSALLVTPDVGRGHAGARLAGRF